MAQDVMLVGHVYWAAGTAWRSQVSNGGDVRHVWYRLHCFCALNGSGLCLPPVTISSISAHRLRIGTTDCFWCDSARTRYPTLQAATAVWPYHFPARENGWSTSVVCRFRRICMSALRRKDICNANVNLDSVLPQTIDAPPASRSERDSSCAGVR